jgi:hypothetical protein
MLKARNQSLDTEYYRGWSDALIAGGKNDTVFFDSAEDRPITFWPCVYGAEGDDKTWSSLVAAIATARSSWIAARSQPNTEPAVGPKPRLTLTAEQEYTIREIIKDIKVPKEKSTTETVGDSVPANVRLYPLPPEVEQKVPQAKSHEFFLEENDTIVLVSPSDRRIANVLKKKSSD